MFTSKYVLKETKDERGNLTNQSTLYVNFNFKKEIPIGENRRNVQNRCDISSDESLSRYLEQSEGMRYARKLFWYNEGAILSSQRCRCRVIGQRLELSVKITSSPALEKDEMLDIQALHDFVLYGENKR